MAVGVGGFPWHDLRDALRVSIACALTAALLATAVGTVEFLLQDVWPNWATRTEWLYWCDPLRDMERVQRREPIVVGRNWSTMAARATIVVAGTWSQCLGLFFFPLSYVAYLGARSLKVWRLVFGSAVLSYATVSLAFILSGQYAFLNYGPAVGFAFLIAALELACPRGSKIRAQAVKQAIVLMVGNILVMNVFHESTVRD
jgi:hypothetical protein